jgi:PGF-pre-PGF domain-containing protein
MKMKADFLSSVISVLLIMLIISGMIPGMAYAADNNETDPVDSTSDLIIESISCNPENPEPGETATIEIAIVNQGTAVSEKTEAVCKIGDEDSKDIPIQAIEPENTLLVSFDWTPEKEGTVKITVTMGDRKKTIEVTVAEEKSADLTIESLTAVPENPEPESEVTVNALVKNKGTKVSEATKLTYKIGEADPKTVKVPEIDPEDSSLVSFTWTPKEEGTVKIKAAMGDSKKTIEVMVAKETSSDLTIESLSVDPENPKIDSGAIIKSLVKNTGTEASEPTNIIYEIGETEKKEEVPAIEAGSETLISHTWTTPDEERTVSIKASLENVENSEKEISVKIVQESLPDLIIEDLYPESSTQPEAGKPLNFILKVKNIGEETASSSTAKYSFNGDSEGEISIPELSAGTSTSAQFSYTPGNEENISLAVVADSEKIVSESNEDNNKMSKTISIKSELPDLKIESISMSPEEPHPGENTTFTVTVKNSGSAAADNSEIKYDIKGNNESYAGVTSIPALAAGETGTGTFFWTPENEGQIEVKATVDAENIISESDETNNEFTKTATVYKETVSSDSGNESSGSSNNNSENESSGSSSSDSGSKSSGSSSSSSGGTILSKEPVSNVEAKELATGNVQSGYHVKFDFPEGVTCITYIEFDPIKTLKRTTTTVEMLKDKSTFVSEVPLGKVYKYVNIWVGNYGAGVANYFENGFIEFKVEKSWLEENNISQSQITLQWYNKGWEPLATEKVKEDTSYVYFKSKTPGFSCFAITSYSAEGKNVLEGNGLAEEAVLRNLNGEANKSVVNESAKTDDKTKNPMGKAKIVLAISLPLFLILVEYFVMKKKI